MAYSSSVRIRNRYWERHLDAIKNCSPAAAASFSHCVSYNAQWVLRQQDEQGIWFLHFTILIQLIRAFRYTDMNTYTDKFTFLEMYLSGKNELKCVEKYVYWGKTHLKLDAFLSIFLKKEENSKHRQNLYHVFGTTARKKRQGLLCNRFEHLF